MEEARGRKILIAMDGSRFAEYAFECKYRYFKAENHVTFYTCIRTERERKRFIIFKYSIFMR